MRKHLTYANVMATMAFLIAIAGGTAYAANTIGSSDIINGQVKSPDIDNNQVQSVDVRDDGLSGGGLTGADIADSSLTSADIANGSLEESDLGPGSVGNIALADGAVTGHMDVPMAVASALDTNTSEEIQVPCRFGTDEVTGGGFVIAGAGGANVPNVAIQRSYAVDDHTWLVRAVATSGTPNWQLTGVATCAF
jgi:hypothetical protein